MKAQNFGYLKFTFVIMAMLLMVVSCDDGKTPTGEVTAFPMPSDPLPANFATDQSLGLWLSWSECSETEVLDYGVYLGTDEETLELIGYTGLTRYWAQSLQPNTTYFWRVEACDGEGMCRKSPVWTFTTEDLWFYPLKQGASWRYERIIQYYNFSVDSMSQYFQDRFTDTIRVSVLSPEIIFDEVEVYPVLEEWENCGMLGCSSRSYFQNRFDGLYYYGTDGYYISAIPHKPVSVTTGTEGVVDFKPAGSVPAAVSLSQDLINPPQRSLAYPLYLGQQWTVVYPEDNDAGWMIVKQVSSRGDVSTPAGEFNCHGIVRLWNYEDDISMIDYIADEGLIVRRAVYRDVYVTEYYSTDPAAGGTCDIIERYRLIDYEL